MDAGLCGRVRNHAGTAAHPGNRSQIDDASATEPDHSRHHGLRRKNVMPQVQRQPFIPVLRAKLFERVPVVARRVVDEHRDGAEFGLHGGERTAQRGDVAHVAVVIARPRRGELLHQGSRGFIGDVAESDSAALLNKSRDNRCADAGRPARHEHRSVGEARVAGRGVRCRHGAS